MWPWIGSTGIGLILNIFNILRALIGHIFVDIICSILGWALAVCFFLVVWSFKKEIEDDVGAGGEVQKV